MANINAPFGLKLVKGIPGTGSETMVRCYIPSTDANAVFIGDTVKVAGSADASGFHPTVAVCAAGNPIFGVVQEVFQVDGLGSSANYYRSHRPASTAMYVNVCVDPNALYEVQASGSIAATDIGLNADLSMATAGNTSFGISGQKLDVAAMDTTATRQVKIMGLAKGAENEIGNYAKLIVKLNNAQLGSHTGTAGV